MSEQQKKIRWGVLGYARIARLHVIPAIMKAKNAEFYAISSRDVNKLNECREKFGSTKAYTSYDELLDDPEIDAVYIPLPNGLHKEWTIKAARKGKHVLCEKPMALNTAECLEMVEESKKQGVRLMEAFMYRYTTRTKMVTELLDSGVIGEVRHINSTFRFFLDRPGDVRLDPGQGGGALYDVGCYPINFAGLVTKSTPVSMAAECIVKEGVDVSFSGVLRYENGILATIHCGFDGYLNQYTQISGTKGVLDIPDTFSDTAGAITVRTAEGTREVAVPGSERYVLEIEDFSSAILEGRPPMFTLEETLRNMNILEQLLKNTYKKQN